MVMDATITLDLTSNAAVPANTVEALYPSRHKMTLPLNSLNNYFEDCETSFNYHTKLDCDRQEKKRIIIFNLIINLMTLLEHLFWILMGGDTCRPSNKILTPHKKISHVEPL